jgi:hypothetical protein
LAVADGEVIDLWLAMTAVGTQRPWRHTHRIFPLLKVNWP